MSHGYTIALTIIAGCAGGLLILGLLIWAVLMRVVVPLLQEIAKGRGS